MNAATLDFDTARLNPVGARECVRAPRVERVSAARVSDTAQWEDRAKKLLALFEDPKLPTTSGHFGSFLY